jgi:hypothetical protein
MSRQREALIATSTIDKPCLRTEALLEVRNTGYVNYQTTMEGIKHVLESRYYDKLKLQRALEKRFPDKDGKFDLKVCAAPWRALCCCRLTGTEECQREMGFLRPRASYQGMIARGKTFYYLINIITGRLEVMTYRYHQIDNMN